MRYKKSGKASTLKERIISIHKNEDGKMGWILLWALGVPIPILVILFILRGCT